MSGLIKRRPLLAFFALAYLGSWVLWSPWWLSRSGLGVLPFQLPLSAVQGINQLGLFAGPFAAAFVVTRVADGREGVRRFRRRFIQWRAHPMWWVLALVGIPLAAGVGYLLVPGVAAAPAGGVAVVGTLAVGYATLILGGPLQEEPGWRGFALPRLQERLHPMAAALLLGTIHCCWHAPLFFTREWDTPRDNPGQLVAYLILVLSMSVVLSWLFNGSGGSLVLAILAHTGINWAQLTVVTLTGTTIVSTWPAALGMALLAVVAAVATRGRLGYTPESPLPGRSQPDEGSAPLTPDNAE